MPTYGGDNATVIWLKPHSDSCQESIIQNADTAEQWDRSVFNVLHPWSENCAQSFNVHRKFSVKSSCKLSNAPKHKCSQKFISLTSDTFAYCKSRIFCKHLFGKFS